jgi:DNA-binding response OmpR family regulator
MPSGEAHGQEGGATSPSVLVIDDDVQLRGFLREVLDQAGYQVFEAGNGNEGSAMYARHRPDLVLTDIVMPEKEGMELIMELRRDHPTLPIIAMSGGNAGFSGSYLTVAGKLGANATLAKPFTASHLLAAIEQLLKPRFATGR